VLFVLHNTPQPDPQLPGVTVYPLETDPGTARFDITLEFWDTPEGLHSRFEYSTDLFEAATIARMEGHFLTLIEAIVTNPNLQLSQLPLLTAEEHRCLLEEWNATASHDPVDQCLHHVFEAQARRTPHAVALVCGDESLTYHELNRRANQVAHFLLASGIGSETLVGLCIERSLAMVIGLLGILKAGAAYLPLDPSYPEERIAFILADARPPVVLTQEAHLGRLPAGGPQLVCMGADWPRIASYPDDDPGSHASPDNLAYLLYTSGTTGNPKGVLGLHCATFNALDWMWRTFPFGDDEVCCQKTSINFGDSIQEWLGPLLHGVRMVLIPDAVLKDVPRLVQTLALHRVTRLILVPTLLRTLLNLYADLSARLPNLRLWFAGGEALSSDLWQRFRDCLPQRRLINLYGASEASDDTTWYDTGEAPSVLPAVPIGRPIANTQLYVLDPYLQPVPIGVSGELYVGGAGLTRGYLHNPVLTAAGFLPDPFSHLSGARLYRTGDVVHYRADGNVEYLGRLDHQVKLRGVRIELEEIEAALRLHAAVRDAVVVVREDVPGDPRLIAYIIPTRTPEPTITELRRFLQKKLPPALVPTAFVMLETVPLTASGKADRRALPDPTVLRPSLDNLYVAPHTPVERQLAALWCQLFGLEQVGIHDDFFELGGHSLLAMQLLARLRDTLGLEVSLRNFFEAPTVAGMAALMTAALGSQQTGHVSAIRPIPRQGISPASIAQEHFWFFDQLLPGVPLFNIPCVVRLRGELRIEVLERCLHELVSRHEALRTTFATVDEQLVQCLAPALQLPLSVWDLRAVPEFEREREAQRLLQEESQRPFNLTHGPLLRGCLLRLGEQEYFLLLALHHIICDGWSLGVLLRELAVLYKAFTVHALSPLAALPIQYIDFAHWQRHWRDDPALEAQLAYWQAQLQDPLPTLALPSDHARGTDVHSGTTRQFFELPGELVDALRARSQQEGCTLFMTCLAAFKILLYAYTGQEDLCVASLVANRTRRETEALIGMLVNTVILRTSLDGNPSCREVLLRVRDTVLAAYANQDLPFEELVRTLEHERRIQRTSLAQVMLIWQKAMALSPADSTTPLRFEVMEESFVPPHLTLTTFDLVLILCEVEQGVRGAWIYKSDLFDDSTISRWLNDFRAVLSCVSTQMEQALVTFRSMWEGRSDVLHNRA
jgi:amino acid adenylation domain-containing protein